MAIVSTGDFSAQVSAWVAETKERMNAVRNKAIEKVIDLAQIPVGAGGNMPVDTGFLRASGRLTTEELPLQTFPPEGAGRGSFSWDNGDVVLRLSNITLENTITWSYTANYARHQEYGARGRAGRRFVGLAVQQWPRIVEEVCAEAITRSGARGQW